MLRSGCRNVDLAAVLEEMADEESKPEEARPKSARGARSYAARAQRSLKDADRALKQNPDRPAEEQAIAHLEQAKVWALLELADSIRDSRTS
jgi:hypothetical protein